MEQAPVGVAVSVLKAQAGMAGITASMQPYSTKEARPSLTAAPIFFCQFSFPLMTSHDAHESVTYAVWCKVKQAWDISLCSVYCAESLVQTHCSAE